MNNKNITVAKILDICNGQLVLGNKDLEINSYSKDSRNIKRNDMYIALKGEKVNGNDYIKEAFKKRSYWMYNR